MGFIESLWFYMGMTTCHMTFQLICTVRADGLRETSGKLDSKTQLLKAILEKTL